MKRLISKLVMPFLAAAFMVSTAVGDMTIYQSSMASDTHDSRRVGGLCFNTQGTGWPSLIMQGGVIEAGGGSTQGGVIAPFPFMFGKIATSASASYQSESASSVSNTLRYGTGAGSDMYITLTRLSPAMLLDTTANEVRLFGTDVQADLDEIIATTMHFGGIIGNYSHSWWTGGVGVKNLAKKGGAVKPLRWATRNNGQIYTGVLDTQTWPGMNSDYATRATSQAGTPATPPLGDLDTEWLLLWYGADSTFVHSETPHVFPEEPYFSLRPPSPLWGVREQAYQADVAILLVPQNAPSNISHDSTNGIIFNFSSGMGKMAVLPLYGHKPLRAADTEQWLVSFPSAVATQCDQWAERLAVIPTNVSESSAYNSSQDEVTFTENFTFTTVRSGGQQRSPLPAMLGLAWHQGLPVTFSAGVTDTGLSTVYGQVVTISGSSYTWTIEGLADYINYTPTIGSSTSESAPLEAELEAEVDKVTAAGPLSPFIFVQRMTSGYAHFANPADALYLLAELMPALSSTKQTQLTNYLINERSVRPPETMLSTNENGDGPWGAMREPFDVFNCPGRDTSGVFGDKTSPPEGHEPTPSLFRAYGLYRYYKITGENPVTDGVITWCENQLPTVLANELWDTLGWYWGKYCWSNGWFKDKIWQQTPRCVNRDMAGLIGYLSLCEMSSQTPDTDAWGRLAKLAVLRYAMTKYGRYQAMAGMVGVTQHTATANALAMWADFSDPNNFVFVPMEINQYNVDLGNGAVPLVRPTFSYIFMDMVPEVGKMLKDWGVGSQVQKYLDRYAKRQANWYVAKADLVDGAEFNLRCIVDPHQMFMAHAWIVGTNPSELERYINVSWMNRGDFYYMHKLAETIKAYRAGSGPDTTAPTPDPLTWSTAPYATGTTSIAMTATTASDVSGVEYYCDCTAGGGHDSGWQDGTFYQDTGLNPSTQYTYRVQARDKSANQNAGGWSSSQSATTSSPPDTTPPTPNPLTWASVPDAISSSSIVMTATTASDPSGVEYYFDCTAGGGNDSGWQDSAVYEDTGLSPDTQYTYRVQARDKSSNQNATGWSTSESATTNPPGQAGSITVVNFSFEQPDLGKIWDWSLIPGWDNDAPTGGQGAGNHCTGVEVPGFGAYDGTYAAFVEGGDEFYQEFDHTIVEGGTYTVKFQACDVYNGGAISAKLFYDDGGRTTIQEATPSLGYRSWTEYTVQFTAQAGQGYLGYDLGVSFSNTSSIGSWLNVDSVVADYNEPVQQDTTAPTPDPLTWATVPYSTGTSSISMVATTASDPSGVEYYFDCIAGGGNDSGWQDSTTYEDTGLSPSTQYTYRVQARDKSANQNAGGWSTSESATTDAPPDTTAPTPEPLTWATMPYSTGTTSISMTATTASDPSGVEYYFECTAGGGNDSGWQDSTTYEDTGLLPSTQYTYRAQARDKSANQNAGSWSTSESATTDTPPDTTAPTPDPLTWASVPVSTGTTSISMTATTASDSSGVEYFFDCTAGGGNDSGWQDSTTYEDTGLTPDTQYTYRVQARDKSTNQNTGGWSTTQSATTDSGSDPNLVGWWKLDETSGTTASDDGTGENDGTVTGATWVTGQVGNALSFDGSDDVVDVASASEIEDLPLGDFTVCFWMNWDQNTSENSDTILGKYGSGGWHLNLKQADKRLTLQMRYDGSDAYIRSANNTVAVDTWQHVAVVFDSSTRLAKIYFDGSETTYGSQTAGVGNYKTDVGTVLQFGRAAYSGFFYRGELDDIRLYNRELSQSEIQAVMSGAPSNQAPSVDAGSNQQITLPDDDVDLDGTVTDDDLPDPPAAVIVTWTKESGPGTVTFVNENAVDTTATFSTDGVYVLRLTADDSELTAYDEVTITVNPQPDTDPPTPDPLTWATVPHSTGTTSISMRATTASDPSGVEYYFECTAGGGNDSGWQDSTTYEDTGLSPSTQYTYRVQARDKSSAQNAGGWSTAESATTDAPPDTTPPTPDPLTWATVPYATGTTSISMTATTASDPSGVEYYFECTAGEGHNSVWQASATYTDTGLNELTQYTYRVRAHDLSSNNNETAWSTTQSATTEDGTAPAPNPLTWATVPYSTGTSSISMIATTASDASGVEYYFDCTAGGGNDSGWQDSTTYEDTGLSPSTQYSYRVQARDKSANQNTGGWSTTQSATTDAPPDTTAPTPDPLTWATVPYATGTTSISMTATTASDPSGVEYYFDCTAGGGNDSGWQDSTTYEDTGLTPDTSYTYRVQARDKNANQNTGGWSTTESATTDSGSDPNLVGWWKLDETSGTTASDDGAGENDGTVSGATWVTGQIGNALSFDGSDDVVDVASASEIEDLPLGDFTVCFWMNWDQDTGENSDTILGKYGSGGWHLNLKQADRRITLQMRYDGSDAYIRSANNTVAVDTWQHVAVVFDSSTRLAKIYFDGSETTYSSQTAGVGNYKTDVGTVLQFGRAAYSGFFYRGELDDIRLYNRKLSSTEIGDIAGQ